MNAHPSDTAHALAHDAAGAMPARSVDAKTREDKATQDKGRHNKGTIGVAASHHVVGLGDVALRIGMMTIEAFQKALIDDATAAVPTDEVLRELVARVRGEGEVDA